MDLIMDCLKVGENGNIEIGGCDLEKLAEK